MYPRLPRMLLSLALLLATAMAAAPRSADTASSVPLTTGTSTNQNIESIGHIGGRISALAVQGSYAYVGMGPEMAVLDISNPANPARVGYVVLPEQVLAVAVVGAYAYVGVGVSSVGVGIVDATDAGLAIVNITNPASPALVSFYSTSSVNDLAIAGAYAYLATKAGDMLIMNISNPAAPTLVGMFHSPDHPLGAFRDAEVVVVGTHVYFADGDGMRVLDISNPAAPAQVGFYNGGQILDIAVVGNYAYVIDGEYDFDHRVGMAIVNISNPAAPAEVGFYSRDEVFAVSVVGTYAYVAGGFDGLRIVNVAKPTKPVEVGHNTPGGQATSVTVAGAYAYVGYSVDYTDISGGANGLQVVNITKPSAPSQATFFQAPFPILDLAVKGNYAYITDGTGLLRAVDISNPANPAVRSSLMPDHGGVSLVVEGNYAYVLSGAGLYVVDISNPALLAQVSRYDLGKAGWTTLALVGHYLYIGLDATYHGVGESGLLILDVVNPAAPTRVSFISGLRGVASITVVGNRAYVGSTNYARYGLAILDVSNPAAPVELGFYHAGGWVHDVVVTGRYAYLTIPNSYDLGSAIGGLRVVDISNPAAPKLVGSYDMLEGAFDLAVADRYAYVTTWDGYLRVFDISNPAMPVQVAYYHDGGDIAVANGYIYLGSNGLSILRLTDAAASGRVMDVNGKPFPGVRIAAGTGLATTTDAAGAYTFTHLRPGRHTLTPALTGYAFEPLTRTVTLGPDAKGQDFTILPGPVSVPLAPGVATTLAYTDTQGLRTDIVVPAGAVTQTTMLRLTPTLDGPAAGNAFAGHAFRLDALRSGVIVPDLTFSQPLSVTIRYSAADVHLITDTAKLALWRWTGGGRQDAVQSCQPAAAYTRDPARRMLRLALCRTGRFGLFGPTRQVYLPAIWN